jgi:hypothetical protein
MVLVTFKIWNIFYHENKLVILFDYHHPHGGYTHFFQNQSISQNDAKNENWQEHFCIGGDRRMDYCIDFYDYRLLLIQSNQYVLLKPHLNAYRLIVF